MDESIARLSKQLSGSSPEAISELKKVFWRGTEHWDELLMQRAEISGRLVLASLQKKPLKSSNKKHRHK
jgi:methylglutaconyl-CoA hydratase